jgi:trehalose/maltose hydrolase-like predicted phosphorylase
VDEWSLTFHGFVPADEGRREALCTLGNGYLATRGAAPESSADGVHYPGTYAAGCYNRLTDTLGGVRVENESLVNLPNWLPVTFRIDDGDWFRPDDVDLLEHRQELDLRRGVLTRRVRFRDAAGRTTRLVQRRMVNMADAHMCGLQTRIYAEDWSGSLHIRAELDGSVTNTGVARYRDLSGVHCRVVSAAPVGDDTVLLITETVESHLLVALAARTRVCRDGQPLAVVQRPLAAPQRVGRAIELDIGPGQVVTVDKLVTVFTSRDRAIAAPGRAALRRLERTGSFRQALTAHVRAWRYLWKRSDVAVTHNEATRGVVRLHLFHLLQTVSDNSADLDTGVPARGLHGEAYRGHVLWDELFVFPILNLRLPLLTRALLRYRFRRLPEARAAASAAGHAGAMYPWQSGSTGQEESQRLHLNPLSGRWVDDPTFRQRHVGLAVAYNVWQYYQATGDREFLAYYGAEMILDIARFWSSIASYEPQHGRYAIRGVMGPDEFHTGYPDGPEAGVDNNAYTNVMAAWVLLRAREVLDLLPEVRRVALSGMLGLDRGEISRWEEISRTLMVPFHGDGIISQFEGYDSLAELDWVSYRERYGDIRRLDRILEAEGDSPNRYRISKQADVLMLFYLLSAEELTALLARLGYRWDPAAIPRTVDYYLERTAHGSTLSAVVHAWVLARGHREQALEYFVEALRGDVADIQGGTTPEGIHLAAMAGSVDLLQRCFAGVEVRQDTLWLNPYWPAALGVLEFPVRYQEQPLWLRVTGDQVRVEAGTDVPVAVRLRCRGQSALLSPGATVVFGHTASGPRV